MNKQQIIEQSHALETKEDLLNLLNQMKKDDADELGNADSYKPFTLKQINFYCNPNNTKHRFRQFKIKKKTKGKFRTITAPRNVTYKLLLSYLNEVFKALYTPSKYAMGFTEGRSVVTNAEVHKGMNYVLNLDLKDFFPSIEQRRVWGRIQAKPFCFKQPVANVIAGLCSMKETRDMEDGTKKDFYVLPQGAPTSPIITNMICDRLDHYLAGLAHHYNLRYTRYADDITFSSMHYVYKKDGEFFQELERIITEQGFHINRDKTRLQRNFQRQEVTGVVVNDKLNVVRKYTRDIRNLLYIWEKHGIGVAECVFYPKYKEDKGHVKKGNPDMINVIGGKLLYLKMVKGESDNVYKRLKERFESLCDDVMNARNLTAHEITYMETVGLQEFEKKNSVQLSIASKGEKRYGYFILNGKKVLVSINKSVKPEDETDKKKLAISLCKGKDGKNFWLLHKASKITVPTPESVNVDELNSDLDSLLDISNG